METKMNLKNRGSILLMVILAATLTAAPSLARMGGGSGGSGSDRGGSMGRGDSSGSGMDRSGAGMMDADESRPDIGSMPALSSGGMGSGDMTMEVRPVGYRDGRLELKYFANTHSVTLSQYDLMELSTLHVGDETYRPVRADRMRGHHSGGRILFEVPERPESFRLIIRGIPRVEERLYDWE